MESILECVDLIPVHCTVKFSIYKRRYWSIIGSLLVWTDVRGLVLEGLRYHGMIWLGKEPVHIRVVGLTIQTQISLRCLHEGMWEELASIWTQWRMLFSRWTICHVTLHEDISNGDSTRPRLLRVAYNENKLKKIVFIIWYILSTVIIFKYLKNLFEIASVIANPG